MKPFWFCRLDHARSLRDHEDAARRVANLVNVPVMKALRRVAVTIKSREAEHGPNSPELVLKHLQNPKGRGAWFDSGRSGKLESQGWIETALGYKPDADIVATLQAYFVVPYVAEEREAVLDAFCSLAEALEAAYGAAGVEPSFQTAHNAAIATGPTAADIPTYKVMTPDRIRYRRTPAFLANQIHCGIGGPEWGTFLGPGHLARLPADTLASNAFYSVRPLAHGGAFIRLSEDPMDAQTDAILGMVARARAALEPIVVDVSSVRI